MMSMPIATVRFMAGDTFLLIRIQLSVCTPVKYQRHNAGLQLRRPISMQAEWKKIT